MSNKTSIITTINDLQDTFVSKFLDDGYKCIIVGDKKTNAGSYANIPGVDYIPAECSTFSDLSEALPFNHYCRKNLGYLHAIQGGVKTILDTDDDNFPISNIYDWRSLNQSVASSSDIPLKDQQPHFQQFATPGQNLESTQVYRPVLRQHTSLPEHQLTFHHL